MTHATHSAGAHRSRRRAHLLVFLGLLASTAVLWAWTWGAGVQPSGVAGDARAIPTAALPAAPRAVSEPGLTPVPAAPLREEGTGATARLRGIVLASGSPCASAAVVVSEIGSDALPVKSGRCWRLTSDASGRFAVEDGPNGGFVRVEAAARGHARARRDVAIPAAGDADEITLELEMLPEPFARVHGTVVGADGKPVPRARVALGAAASATDRDGCFALLCAEADPEADLVVVALGAEPLVRVDFGATLAPGADRGVRLVLEGPGGSISGTVRDSAGAPLKNWKVALDGDDPAGAAIGRAPARTDARGAFTIAGVGRGTYALRAWSGRREGIRVEGIDAGTSGVELRVP
jgi:hypothetical protein